MMNNTLKSALLTIAFLFVAAVTSFSTVSLDEMTGGSIIVEGNTLTSTSDDLKDQIITTYLMNSSGNVYEYRGCSLSECSSDVSNLPSGEYDAIVISTEGGFTGYVVKD